MRARQTLDYMQEGVRRGDATMRSSPSYGSEVGALVRFPAPLFTAAGLPAAGRAAAPVPRADRALRHARPTRNNSPSGGRTWKARCPICSATRTWRGSSGCSPVSSSSSRRNTATASATGTSSSRSNTARPHSSRSRRNRSSTNSAPSGSATKRRLTRAHHRELVDKFEGLRLAVAHKVPVEQIVTARGKELSGILEDDFKISARRAGDKGDVIEETALEARVALTNSLAAAKADQWQEAESQRLDAYTNFDSARSSRACSRATRNWVATSSVPSSTARPRLPASRRYLTAARRWTNSKPPTNARHRRPGQQRQPAQDSRVAGDAGVHGVFDHRPRGHGGGRRARSACWRVCAASEQAGHAARHRRPARGWRVGASAADVLAFARPSCSSLSALR